MMRRLLVPVALCFTFVSADAKPRKAISSLNDLGADETVVVGRDVTEEPGFGDFRGRIDAALGEEFMVRQQ